MISREWRGSGVSTVHNLPAFPVSLTDANSPAPEFGDDRPAASDIKRRLENLRDTALDKRHVQNFSIKRFRSDSTKSQRSQHRVSDATAKCSSASPSAVVLKQEELSDCVVEDTLMPAPSAAGTLRIESRRTSNKTYPNPNTSSRRRKIQRPHLPQRGHTPADDNDDLPELETIIETKDKGKDMMKLRSMPKPEYQNDGVTYHDDDTEYDPVAERAEQDRKQAQKERQRQRAIRFAAAQSTFPPADRSHSEWTDSDARSTPLPSDIMSSQTTRNKIAQS